MQVLRDPAARSPAPTVFVFQPQWFDRQDLPGRMPCRLVTLLGALRARGTTVVLAEEAHDGPPVDAWRDALRDAVLCVGWCAEMYPGTQIPGLLRLLDVARFDGGPPLVVGGGFFPLVDVERLGLAGRVDGVALEPGEVVVPEIVEALLAGRPLAEVAGVCSWSGGAYRANPAPRRRALDPRFYAVLRELDFARYGAHVEPLIFDNLEPAVQVPTGAGCAKACPFCFDERSPYGVFPAPAIVDAVAFVVRERGVRQVLLGELDFFHRRDRALAVADGLARLREGSPGLAWFALGSVVDLARWSERELDRLAQAGCHRLELGSESGSAAQLARLGKRHQPLDAVLVTRRLAERGVRTSHNLLLGAPGETAEDRAATVRLAGRLIDAGRGLARVQPRIYQVVPLTTLGAEALPFLRGAPETLEEILEYRGGLEGDRPGTLPWLGLREERWVRELVEYVLPLAYGAPDPAGSAGRRGLARMLRGVARLRCLLGVGLGLAWERQLFAAGGLAHLPGTLVR